MWRLQVLAALRERGWPGGGRSWSDPGTLHCVDSAPLCTRPSTSRVYPQLIASLIASLPPAFLRAPAAATRRWCWQRAAPRELCLCGTFGLQAGSAPMCSSTRPRWRKRAAAAARQSSRCTCLPPACPRFLHFLCCFPLLLPFHSAPCSLPLFGGV